ncbi:magnesium/cobalt transporter CorA [Alkalimonas amylolytica]|uniref:Magnesium transport protein CorA n=1 Tax=Alkalimonas amylolytica TaxID=152573 RepID=A0A1H4D334_ALKAM|nr:magnesium/cobalt transporter CorA [Alkalimonas amylolytica]SEA67001.1 magnesium transporter [Alkalimonas amylolytica]
MAGKLVRKKGKKAGSAPGTLVFSGASPDAEAHWQLLQYNLDSIEQLNLSSLQQLPPAKPDSVRWLNLCGLPGIAPIEQLGQVFSLHPLVLEDMLNTDHRPKVEAHPDYLFVVFKMLRFHPDSREIRAEQISLVLMEQTVISLQETPGNDFDGVVQRLLAGRRLRGFGADYLAYALLDAVVDHYFILLEQCGDHIEQLENELMTAPTTAVLAKIHHFKREMLLLRKVVWPLRELLSSLLRDENPLIKPETRIFLRDVYDHCVHIIDTMETLRDVLSGLLDLYLTSVSNRTNEVMKVLTMMASIFIPLTFIAGIYGMNFEVMPELGWQYGYALILGLMACIGGGLLWYFRRRGWW